MEKRSETEGTVHGKFTLRGVTVPLDLPFRVNRVGRTIYGLHTVAGFSSSLTLDRTAFGMKSNLNSVGTTVTCTHEQLEESTGGPISRLRHVKIPHKDGQDVEAERANLRIEVNQVSEAAYSTAMSLLI